MSDINDTLEEELRRMLVDKNNECNQLKNKIKIYSTFIEESIDYTSVNYKGACAIIVGAESSSLTNQWKLKSSDLIKIPMNGKMDSLNLSVSAAIVIFEALKQRNAI